MNISIPQQLSLLNWRDILEIFFFSCCFYLLARWLSNDPSKNLVSYFFTFCMVIVSAQFLGLSTISQLALLYGPPICMLFMFLHQETLQKNLVSLKNIAHPIEPQKDWLSILMQGCLALMHNNTKLIILLEHTDALEPYIYAEHMFVAPINRNLLSLLVEHVYNSQQMLWLRSDGTIRGVNVSWRASWHPDAYENGSAWLDDAIAHTCKNDALILQIDPATHHYSLVFNGILQDKLSIEQVNQIIRKTIQYPKSVTKKGLSHDVTSKKNNVAQQHS